MIRNKEIVQKSDYIIAFWDGEPKGTLDSIKKDSKKNKNLFVFNIFRCLLTLNR